MTRDKRYGPGARAMADKDSKSGGRDETNEVGSGRRKIVPQKQGKPKVQKDGTQKFTNKEDK